MSEDLKALLADVFETLRMMEHTPCPDPIHHEEVKALGKRIGFGALMSTAEAAWREHLQEQGYPVGGEFVSGPCRGSINLLLAKVRAALSPSCGNEG